MTSTQFMDHPQQVCSQCPDTGAPDATVVQQQAAKQFGPVCPRCGEAHLRKNGRKGGHQRFLCMACGKTIGDSYGRVNFRSKRPPSTWVDFINGVEHKRTLRELAERCCISVHTACHWRKRYLEGLVQQLDKFLDEAEARGLVKNGTDLKLVRQIVASKIDGVYRGRSLQKAKELLVRKEMRILEKIQRKQARGLPWQGNNPFIQNPMNYTDHFSTL